MTGDELRIARQIKARLLLQHAQRGERNGHERRLRIFSKRERVGRPFENDGAQLAAQAVSTSSNTCCAAVKFDASVLPIPTAWLPCPGNTKATAMYCPLIVSIRRNRAERHLDTASVKFHR